MSTLSRTDRDTLSDVADVLIPATDTMPALRDADPDGDWLDRACRRGPTWCRHWCGAACPARRL